MVIRPPERSAQEASSVKRREFESRNNNNCCDEDCASARLCRAEAGSKAAVSKSRRSDCARKCRENVSDYNWAACLVGDCVAVCCCPCAVAHLLILAFVKLPLAIARKAFSCAQKMAPFNRKFEGEKKTGENDDDDDDQAEKWRGYSPPWSYRESPPMTVPLEGSPSPKFDGPKLWSELYASGHMGFGGVPCERD